MFPAGDLGVRAALMRLDERSVVPAPREAARRAEPWSPFRSYAASYLWRLAASAANASEIGNACVE
jgi:3-methyladenine DNA glycosylase/8-oxoguanine DNA glycosylase